MKRNTFGETIIQPDDDPTALWAERFGDEDSQDDPPPELEAIEINDEDLDTFGWTCSIRDRNNFDNEMQVHDFPTREALETFLTSHHIKIET